MLWLRRCRRLTSASVALGAAVLGAALGCSSNGAEESGNTGRADAGSSAGPTTTGGVSSAGGSGGASSTMPVGGTQSSGAGGSLPVAGTSSQAGNGSAGSGGSAGVPSSGPIECRSKGDGKSTITLVNHCTGTLSFRGSDIEGGDLEPGEHACRDVGNATDELPAIRYWGFIGEDPGGEKHTLAELTLNTDFNDFDWYNISHVDAHNLPMRVEAFDMPDCRALTCAESLLEQCPAEGRLEDAAGNLISCFSPNRDDPNSTVAQYFEASCADAYSWSGDDQESVVACAGEDYDVIFCP